MHSLNANLSFGDGAKPFNEHPSDEEDEELGYR